MLERLTKLIKASDLTRMQGFAWVAIATSIAILAIYPQQAGVVLFKANLLALAAWAGYWIDRAAFPYGRPHTFRDHSPESISAQMRRAIIIAASMVAFALAL